jgi:hypothetical protein
MKASKGTELYCDCGKIAVRFVADLGDNDPVTSNNMAICLDRYTITDDNAYKCSVCRKVVAQRVGTNWRVMTSNGYIE